MAHILIIDDERLIRHALKEILEYEKHTVEEAPDGAAGLKAALEGKYDVIFCDVKMPEKDGMHKGFAFVQFAQKKDAEVKNKTIIFCPLFLQL